MTILIGNDQVYKYKEVEKVDDEDSRGECNIETKIIKIKKSLKGKEKIEAQLHEALHMFCDVYTFDLDEKLEEFLCSNMEHFLLLNFDIKMKP